MNDTLVAFASKLEFNAIYPHLSAVVASTTPFSVGSFDVTVCGVGLLNFSLNLAFLLAARKYKRVFQVGICGAYPEGDFGVLDVVRVDSDIVGDMGVQTASGHFVAWKDVVSEDGVYCGDSPRLLPLSLASVPSAAGVTVNCCTGTKYLGLRRRELFKADVETMEGAACFAVCKRFGVSAYQFRAVSNIASDRNPSAWKVAEALAALKSQVIDVL